MLFRKGTGIRSSEITPEGVFQKYSQDRRRFLATATLGAGALAAAQLPSIFNPKTTVFADTQRLQTIGSKYTLPDVQTPEAKATTFNNFYEFGTDKSDPSKNAHTLQTRPWTVEVDGMVAKPVTLDVDSIMHYRPIENRVYRHRCVERWSMVIPWDGYSLSEFIKFCQPTPSAKYVQFISKIDKKQMPDLPGGFNWPVLRGLAAGRSDESAGAALLRVLRKRVAEPERSANPGGCAMEVWVQERKIDCQISLHGQAAEDALERYGFERVWVLFER